MHYKDYDQPTDEIPHHKFLTPKTLTISRMELKDVYDEREKKSKRQMQMYVTHNGTELKQFYNCPKLIRVGLAELFGSVETDDWIGKEITLYATECKAFGKYPDCTRVIFPVEVERKIMAHLKGLSLDPQMYRKAGLSMPEMPKKDEPSKA